MTLRVENGVAHTQTFNAENKLAHVEWTDGGYQCRTEFLYDGGGNGRIERLGGRDEKS